MATKKEQEAKKVQKELEPSYGMESGKDIRTSYISGRTFKNKPVQYSIVDGMAMFEGCIALGTAEEMEARRIAVEQGGDSDDAVQHGVGHSDKGRRWPGGLMPYTIKSSMPSSNRTRINAAIDHWKTNTRMRFVERTSANASQYPNYVEFTPATGCWSQVGMVGGKQQIGLASGCSTGSTIHEIGHAYGLWHEQSREDRDSHVTIHWQNIQSGKEHNFNQHISDGDDIGAYDYGSIMHYPKWAFSKNGNDTITTKPPGTPIGQRSGLSAGDIAAIHAMYELWHYNLSVSRAYTSHHARNAHALLQGMGWRKMKPEKNDAVGNMFEAFCEAVANSRKVHVLADGQYVYRVQLL